jgi:hypothetical protein
MKIVPQLSPSFTKLKLVLLPFNHQKRKSSTDDADAPAGPVVQKHAAPEDDVAIDTTKAKRSVSFANDVTEFEPTDAPLTNEEKQIYFYGVSALRPRNTLSTVSFFTYCTVSNKCLCNLLLFPFMQPLDLLGFVDEQDRTVKSYFRQVMFHNNNNNKRHERYCPCVWKDGDNGRTLRGIETLVSNTNAARDRQRHGDTVLGAHRLQRLRDRSNEKELRDVSCKSSKPYRNQAARAAKEDCKAAAGLPFDILLVNTNNNNNNKHDQQQQHGRRSMIRWHSARL